MSENNAIQLLDRKNSIGIKGIAAIMIMLGHYMTNKISPYFAILFPGQCWVGIFFLYSGFGLQFKEKNKMFTTEYIKEKIKTVLISFWIAESIYTVSCAYLQGGGQKLTDIIYGCIGLKLYNSVLWYVIELVAIYVLFALVIRLKLSPIIWGLIYCIWILVAVYFDIGTWWYISTFNFVLGIALVESHKVLNLFNNKYLKLFASIAFILLYVLRYCIKFNLITIKFIRVGYIETALDMLIIPLFVIVVECLIDWLNVYLQSNICNILGNISYYIYLYHMLVSLWINHFIGNQIIGVIVSIILTGIISIIIYKYKFKLHLKVVSEKY